MIPFLLAGGWVSGLLHFIPLYENGNFKKVMWAWTYPQREERVMRVDVTFSGASAAESDVMEITEQGFGGKHIQRTYMVRSTPSK